MLRTGGFANFIFYHHRKLLFYIVGLLAFHAILIKILFPYTLVLADGNQYVRTAINNVELTAWPIGYPKFLEWMHFLSHGDRIIFIVQYLLMEGSVVWLYFSVKYLFSPGKLANIFLLIGLFMNPFILFVNNYVMTDALFGALTVFWFTITLWYLHKPGLVKGLTMITLTFLAFTIRYYAVFYPIIATLIILFSSQSWKMKLACVGLECLLFFGFVQYTQNIYEKQIGRREFSPFSGWQLAGNALIMYRHIMHREADTPAKELYPLHQLVLRDLQAMPSITDVPDRVLSHYFSWKRGSPLVEYSRAFYGIDPSSQDLKRWALMGKMYKQYGAFLIKTHPLAYLRYYIGQGVDWFIDPIDDMPNVYREGGMRVTERTKNWLGYPSSWVRCSNTAMYSITWFPILLNFLHLLVLLAIGGFYFLRINHRVDSITSKTVILTFIYWAANFLFIITSAPMMLRYGLSVMIFEIAVLPIIVERIYLTISNSSLV